MPSITLVAVGRLDKDGRITEAFSKYFTADVIKSNALADMTPCLFNHRIAVDVGQKTQTETFRVARVCEAVDSNRRLGRVERLANSRVKFIIADRTPKGWLTIHDRLGIDRWTGRDAADI